MNDNAYAQIQVQLQILAAQNELLTRNMGEQQRALSTLREDRASQH